MDQLERLQVLTEVVRELKTAINLDQEVDKLCKMVLDIVREVQDLTLYELIRNVTENQNNREKAIAYVDEATRYLHGEIEKLINK